TKRRSGANSSGQHQGGVIGATSAKYSVTPVRRIPSRPIADGLMLLSSGSANSDGSKVAPSQSSIAARKGAATAVPRSPVDRIWNLDYADVDRSVSRCGRKNPTHSTALLTQS